MKPALLASQFAALERPVDALTVEITASPDRVVEQIISALSLGSE